nr:DNA translocase FtsK 4TM domain-containing protein [Chthoniobacterales bacterium]
MAAVARRANNNAWNEVFALILLGIATLLFLALISYAPKDLPAWLWFSKVATPNSPAQNFIGPLGAIVAGFCYFMIGAASYLLAAALLGLGAAKLFHAELNVSRRAGWIALFVISGACLLHLQSSFLRDWHS